MRGVRRAGGGGSSGGGGGGGRHRSGLASDSYLLDPLLLPRLEQYAHNNQLSNINNAVDYLRTNYREYRRKQQGPFRKLVIKAVHILKRRHREHGGGEDDEDEDDDRDDRSKRAALLDGEDILQEREERHIMRYRAGVSRRSDELEAESLENSSENSDGVESEGMSEGDGGGADIDERGKQQVVLDRNSSGGGKGRTREANGKGIAIANNRVRGSPSSRRKRIGNGNGNRREGKEKETSDSEEELAFDGDEEKPSFNLLNSSLRATYNGRPSLILESCVPEKNGFAAGSSSSLFKFSPLPKGVVEDRGNAYGESSRAGAVVSNNAVEENPRAAFAPPSVVAEAARAAMTGKRSRKGPVIDQETREAYGKGKANLQETREAYGKGSPSVASTERGDLYRGSPPAQSSGRPPQAQKLNWLFQPSSYSAPEVAVARKLATDLSAATDQAQIEDARLLERVESGVGTFETSGRMAAKRERENGKIRSSKKQKSENRRLQSGGEKSASAAGGPAGATGDAAPRNVSFKDLGGIEETLEIIRENIEYPLAHPELYEHLGVQPPRGVLLHGPPGCGKTMLANAIAVETGVPFLKISAPEVVSGMSGESEAKVRALFAEAVRLAPCIIFIDEIDAITPKRETAQREMERRIVAQLLTCMDDLNQPLADKEGGSLAPNRKKSRHVVVIGATNRPDALDPALRRAGRFDREIALGIPDEKARARILAVLAQNLRLEGSFDFKQIAKRTPGFVGADLAALIKEAAAVAVKRIFISRDPRLSRSLDSKGTLANGTEAAPKAGSSRLEDYKNVAVADMRLEDLSTLGVVKGSGSPESASVCKEMDTDDVDQEHWKQPWTHDEMESLAITMQDFEDAVAKVQPSAKREGFATIPDVSWDDVGSLGPVREELEFSISRPIKHPEEYQAMGLDMATGVLLYGPPGCGKTLVAKAIANDAGANFISVKGPELLNKYVGESERAVRQLFTRARASAPCVLFFDEMDAMAPKRGNDGNAAAERVVNQLLTEMDGLESRKSIFIIAATNRPDMIDPALMRPGRLDKLLYVPLPDPQGRGSILRTLVRKVPLAADVDVTSIGESARCEGFSGADLASLVREACIASMRERIKARGNSSKSEQTVAIVTEPLVAADHFNAAFTRVFPSVSAKDRMRYDALCKRLRCARGNINSEQEADVTS
ncbi:unnamed protein product [Calypogeia fissa]